MPASRPRATEGISGVILQGVGLPPARDREKFLGSFSRVSASRPRATEKGWGYLPGCQSPTRERPKIFLVWKRCVPRMQESGDYSKRCVPRMQQSGSHPEGYIIGGGPSPGSFTTPHHPPRIPGVLLSTKSKKVEGRTARVLVSNKGGARCFLGGPRPPPHNTSKYR